MGVRSNLDANFDFEIVDEFLDHYFLFFECMEVMIIDLSKVNNYERSINELFRVFHNIKSASGYLKLASMAKLASFVEDELEALRKANPPISEETTNWLLDVSDMFATWQDDFKLDNDLSRIRYSLLKIPDLDK